MINTKFSVLIIGCGNIAGNFDMKRKNNLPPVTHAGALHNHDGFEIKACVDIDKNKSKTFADFWGIPFSTSKIEEIVENNLKFDLISICTPTNFHEKHIEAAICLKPKIIFCEKPFTSNATSSARLIEKCISQGIDIVVNYTRFWDPKVRSMIDELHANKWGEIRSVVGHYNKGILNNGSHLIQILLDLLGPLQIVSTLGCNYDYWQDDPTISALLKTINSDIPVFLNTGNANNYSLFELEIFCEGGLIRMQSGGMRWLYRSCRTSDEFTNYKTLEDGKLTDGMYLMSMSNAIDDIYKYLIGKNSTLKDKLRKSYDVERLCFEILNSALDSQHVS